MILSNYSIHSILQKSEYTAEDITTNSSVTGQSEGTFVPL